MSDEIQLGKVYVEYFTKVDSLKAGLDRVERLTQESVERVGASAADWGKTFGDLQESVFAAGHEKIKQAGNETLSTIQAVLEKTQHLIAMAGGSSAALPNLAGGIKETNTAIANVPGEAAYNFEKVMGLRDLRDRQTQRLEAAEKQYTRVEDSWRGRGKSIKGLEEMAAARAAARDDRLASEPDRLAAEAKIKKEQDAKKLADDQKAADAALREKLQNEKEAEEFRFGLANGAERNRRLAEEEAKADTPFQSSRMGLVEMANSIQRGALSPEKKAEDQRGKIIGVIEKSNDYLDAIQKDLKDRKGQPAVFTEEGGIA